MENLTLLPFSSPTNVVNQLQDLRVKWLLHKNNKMSNEHLQKIVLNTEKVKAMYFYRCTRYISVSHQSQQHAVVRNTFAVQDCVQTNC